MVFKCTIIAVLAFAVVSSTAASILAKDKGAEAAAGQAPLMSTTAETVPLNLADSVEEGTFEAKEREAVLEAKERDSVLEAKEGKDSFQAEKSEVSGKSPAWISNVECGHKSRI